MDIRELTLEEWDELLPSSGFEVFHTPEALAVTDAYATGDLRLLGGFRGQEAVGLLPVFVRDRWSMRFVVSPPPGLSVPRLGPVVMSVSPKRRKQEKVNQRFAEGVLSALNVDDVRTLFGMVSGHEYDDPRPYRWEGLGVTTRFSYVLEDRTADDLIDSFTRDLRSEIRKGEDLDVSIEVEGPDMAETVCRELKERHAEQGLTYPTPTEYASDLVAALGDRARVYVARGPDGEYLSGITALYSNDEAVFWQGGTKASYDGVSVNSLLHWRILSDVLEDPDLDGIERYDLGNANNRRIARYKSKFDAELLPHYETKSKLMTVAKKAYSARRHLKV